MFILGEEVNPESDHIRIRVTIIHEDTGDIEVVVIKAEGHFAESRGGEHGHPQDGFRVGMKLLCYPVSSGHWSVREKTGKFPNIPWFDLCTQKDHTKTFIHYR